MGFFAALNSPKRYWSTMADGEPAENNLPRQRRPCPLPGLPGVEVAPQPPQSLPASDQVLLENFQRFKQGCAEVVDFFGDQWEKLYEFVRRKKLTKATKAALEKFQEALAEARTFCEALLELAQYATNRNSRRKLDKELSSPRDETGYRFLLEWIGVIKEFFTTATEKFPAFETAVRQADLAREEFLAYAGEAKAFSAKLQGKLFGGGICMAALLACRWGLEWSSFIKFMTNAAAVAAASPGPLALGAIAVASVGAVIYSGKCKDDEQRVEESWGDLSVRVKTNVMSLHAKMKSLEDGSFARTKRAVEQGRLADIIQSTLHQFCDGMDKFLADVTTALGRIDAAEQRLVDP